MTPEEVEEKLWAVETAIRIREWSDAIAFLAHLAIWCHSEFSKDEKIKDMKDG